jgi:GntR family transcriptional regulator, phosphonate transport system regulatory protein
MTVRVAGSPEAIGRDSLWRKIAEELQQDIQKDVLNPGDRIPTEQKLAVRFGVNRHTVRRAIAELAELGVLRAEQGRGTFVQKGRIDYQITRRTRFSATMRAQERETGGALLAATEDRADQRTAASLQIAVGAPVTVLRTLRSADGYPVAVGSHSFSRQRFPEILRAFERSGSITDALADGGVKDYVRGRTGVSARLPTPEEARLLQVPKTRPLLVTEAINLDMEGNPIELGIACFPADRVQLVFEP